VEAAVHDRVEKPDRTEAARLRLARIATAVLAAAVALVYALIGFEVLYIGETKPGDPSLLWFGVPAALAFGFGAVVMVASDRKLLWALGALFQVFVIWAYFDVAPQRTPPFEVWGILLRFAQAAILVALAYLLVRHPARWRRARAERRDARPVGS
jgi:peptidoglycan/LPS O-acetylase OafA/YrhL